MEGVRQMHEAVTTGNLSAFKVHEVRVPNPSEYTPADVQALRDTLSLTQAMFGQVIGVSTETVEHWEQGLRRPAASARRLMDQIKSSPDAFLFWLMRNAPSPAKRAGKEEMRDATKAAATAYLKLAARLLSQREMAQAVREAYAEQTENK